MSKVKVDMHTHSEYSPDSRTPLRRQAAAVKAAGLHVICATDHNTIDYDALVDEASLIVDLRNATGKKGTASPKVFKL